MALDCMTNPLLSKSSSSLGLSAMSPMFQFSGLFCKARLIFVELIGSPQRSHLLQQVAQLLRNTATATVILTVAQPVVQQLGP
jgi:hypothetical protein